jgi:thiol-disulfide isomerase/thioredoxin
MRPQPAHLAALAFLVAGARLQAVEPVKHLLPAQYRDRIVAPRKGRVLLVNFWATWCEPCREEMPALVAAAKRFGAKDVAVVLVSLDSQKTGPASVPKFLASLKVPFVCWLAKTRDPQELIDIVDPSWDGTLPYTVVYDRKGSPAVKLMGAQTEASFAGAVRKAL